MQVISKTKKIILSALLITLSVVLSKIISIKTPLLSISFNFVPIMLSAVWFGLKYSTLIAVIADVIGAILFPFGEFFIGFTISAGVMGLIYGLVLYSKNKEFSKIELVIRLTISSVLVILIVNTLLNTLWLVIMYNKAFIVVLGGRIVKEIIMLPIQVITMFALLEGLKPITKKYLYEEV